MREWTDEDGLTQLSAPEREETTQPLLVGPRGGDSHTQGDSDLRPYVRARMEDGHRLATGYLAALSAGTRIRYLQGKKAPKGDRPPSLSHLRYVVYEGAGTVGEYRDLHPVKALATADLTFDLTRGYVFIHEDDEPLSVKLATMEACSPYVRAPGEIGSGAEPDKAQIPHRFAASLGLATRILVLHGPHHGPTIKQSYTDRYVMGDRSPKNLMRARSKFDLDLCMGRILVHEDDMPGDLSNRVASCAPRKKTTTTPVVTHPPRVWQTNEWEAQEPTGTETTRARVELGPQPGAQTTRARVELGSQASTQTTRERSESWTQPGDKLPLRRDDAVTERMMKKVEDAILHTREMENLESCPADPDALGESTDTTIRRLIGDERQYSPYHIRLAKHLSDSISHDHDDESLQGYTHPIDPGVSLKAQMGQHIPTSVTNAEGRDDYGGDHGWQASLQKEIKRVEGFRAWELVSAQELQDAKRLYLERVSIGHIVIAFRVKSDAEGNAKDPGITKKSRVAFADEKGQTGGFLDT